MCAGCLLLMQVILRTDRATYKPPHWAFCKDTKAHKPYSVDSNDRLKVCWV